MWGQSGHETAAHWLRVKRVPAMWETQARSLGWEDALEKEMAIRSGTLGWKILWM